MTCVLMEFIWIQVASRYERILAKKPEPIVPLVTAAFLDER